MFVKKHLPFVDQFRVNLQCPHKPCKHFDWPAISKNVLDILYVHAKLIAEAFLDIEGNFSKDAMNCRDSLIRDRDLRKIWILEETIIWLFSFDSERLSLPSDIIESASLWIGNFTSRQHINVPAVLVLHSALSVLGSFDSIDVNSRAFVLFSLHWEVDIDTQLTVFNACLRNSKSVEKLLKLSHNQFRIVRVSGLWMRHDLQ